MFFSSRDAQNRSHIYYVDMVNGLSMGEAPQLVLEPGGKGTFDQHGVSPCCVVEVEGKLWLYYLGWKRGIEVPFQNSIGLAIWDDAGKKFEKFSEEPILAPNSVDSLTLSYPFVLRDKSGFRMWYGSHLSWGKDGFPMQHVIKHAYSQDGIHWEREGHICLDVQGNDYAFSRPFVKRKKEGFEMYYCFRGEAYRIGYATSQDGLSWERKDHLISLKDLPAWASEMQCYPAITSWNGKERLLFNGNQYGKTGIGVVEEIRKMRE
jgi:hypothetical protein